MFNGGLRYAPTKKDLFMIKLFLRDGMYSAFDECIDLRSLLKNKHDEVILSCDEPRYKMRGEIENRTAAFLSSCLPHNYYAIWDKNDEGYIVQKNAERRLPPKISELRFGILLKEKM